MSGWIGVDLDGTLAHYAGWKGVGHIGDPVPAMVERVKKWLANGQEVRIFTARIAEDDDGSQEHAIFLWCEKHIGQRLPVTCRKDFAMVELWDDRCVQVRPNTGQPVLLGFPRSEDAGPTGRFPEGRLNEQDEGELAVAIAADRAKGVVIFDFGKPVAWMAITQEEALGFAKLVIEKAMQLG